MRAWCDRGTWRVVRGSGWIGASSSSLRTGVGDEIVSTRGFRAGRSAEGAGSETDGSTGCRFGVKSASAAWGELSWSAHDHHREGGAVVGGWARVAPTVWLLPRSKWNSSALPGCYRICCGPDQVYVGARCFTESRRWLRRDKLECHEAGAVQRNEVLPAEANGPALFELIVLVRFVIIRHVVDRQHG
jgi:hypothetical protein